MEELKPCKYCGAEPYKDSVPCESEEMARQCKLLNKKLDKIWNHCIHGNFQGLNCIECAKEAVKGK